MSRHAVPHLSTFAGWLTVDALSHVVAESSAQGASKPIGSYDGLDSPRPTTLVQLRSRSASRGNLFLVPLDTHRSWYRYHHLFADVLQARLRAEAPDQVPRLHLRASDWFGSHGSAEEAVRDALAAGDFHGAAYLMEEALPALRRTRQDGLLLGWLRSLPEPVIQRSPVLSIFSDWSLMVSGDFDAVERRLDDAEATLAEGAHDADLAAAWALTDELRTAPATISVYRASLAQARGDVAATVRHARRALGLAGAEDHLVGGAGSGSLGLAAWAAGDVGEAVSTFSAAIGRLHAAGNLVDELDSTAVLADMWVASGRPSRARRLCERGPADGHRRRSRPLSGHRRTCT